MNIVHMSTSPGALADVLERARQLLAGGWAEPFSLDAAGKICTPDDEGVSRFCFDDALLVAAGHDGELAYAASTVVKYSREWLEEPSRTQQEVLQVVARAAARARAEAGVDTYRPEASL